MEPCLKSSSPGSAIGERAQRRLLGEPKRSTGPGNLEIPDNPLPRSLPTSRGRSSHPERLHGTSILW
eukprot:scaffold1_cov402-Prasinococcus_capsulatus_cf.AAC.19